MRNRLNPCSCVIKITLANKNIPKGLFIVSSVLSSPCCSRYSVLSSTCSFVYWPLLTVLIPSALLIASLDAIYTATALFNAYYSEICSYFVYRISTVTLRDSDLDGASSWMRNLLVSSLAARKTAFQIAYLLSGRYSRHLPSYASSVLMKRRFIPKQPIRLSPVHSSLRILMYVLGKLVRLGLQHYTR